MSLANALRELMEIRGIGPAELAYKTERYNNAIHKATINRILDGSRTPNLKTFVVLSQALGIQPSEFLERAGLSKPRASYLPLPIETHVNAISNLPEESQEYLTSMLAQLVKHEWETHKRSAYNDMDAFHIIAANKVTREEKEMVRNQLGNDVVETHLEPHDED